MSDPVPRETHDRLRCFLEQLLDENDRQNLISRHDGQDPWRRHVEDSLQLIPLAPSDTQTWLDIGSGGGLPGLVLAISRPDLHMTLVEPRRLRASFLERCRDNLDLDNVTVVPTRVEQLRDGVFDVISARAVADTAAIFGMAQHLATLRTCWILPKGRSAQREVADAARSWQGHFHIEQSRTDPTAGIIVAQHVQPRINP